MSADNDLPNEDSLARDMAFAIDDVMRAKGLGNISRGELYTALGTALAYIVIDHCTDYLERGVSKIDG